MRGEPPQEMELSYPLLLHTINAIRAVVKTKNLNGGNIVSTS